MNPPTADELPLRDAPTLEAGLPASAHASVPEQAAPLPDVPGYAIEGVLGRGGMGVVYRAQHLVLKRTVALKMILAGGHAGEAERARFQAEAEAVARLHHPNIVQIYEVGEHGGLPYLSLEFIDGGSLAARLDGTPFPPAAAAELIEVLARTMHAAHQQGIIHRDLKPANVLLGERSDAVKITDFGLAKRIDLPSGVTASGAILGTPSYMAPEQAAGKSDRIGPCVDVYALGAILYECLTGRPPFTGATPVDTILQVLEHEPVPPRRLQPGVPADLETICLKCLHKDPRKRYDSAGELADDLQRWRSHLPIRARRVGWLGRARRWCERNPALAALVGLVALLLVVLAAGGGFGAVYQAELRARAERRERDALAAEAEASEGREKADAAHRESLTRVLEAYEGLAAADLSQARMLWSAPESGRQQAALARLRHAAVLAAKSRALAAGLPDELGDWRARTGRFWDEQMPQLRAQAVRWLADASLQHLATRRVSMPGGIFVFDVGSRFLVEPGGRWVVGYSADPPQATLNCYDVLTNHLEGWTYVLSRAKDPPLPDGNKPNAQGTRTTLVPSPNLWFLPGGDQVLLAWRDLRLSPAGKPALRMDLHALPSCRFLRSDYLELDWEPKAHPRAQGFLPHVVLTSADRERIVLVPSDFGFPFRKVWLWDRRAGKPARVVDLPDTGRPYALSASGEQLLLYKEAGGERRVEWIGLADGQPRRTTRLPAHRPRRSAQEGDLLLLSPDQRWFALAEDREGSIPTRPRISLIDTATGQPAATVDLPALPNNATVRAGLRLIFRPDSRVLVAASGRWIEVLAVPDGTRLLSRELPQAPTTAVTDTPATRGPRYYSGPPDFAGFSSDGARLFTSLCFARSAQEFRFTYDFTLHAWDLAAGDVTAASCALGSSLYAVAADPAGKVVAFGASDGTLLASPPRGNARWSALGVSPFVPLDPVMARMAWGLDPSGRVNVGKHRDHVELRDTRTGQWLRDLPADRLLAVAPRVRFFAVRDVSPRQPTRVRILATAENRWVASFPWPDVSTAAFSPEGNYLAASSGSTLYLASVSDGRVLVALPAEQFNTFHELAFAGSDRLLVSRKQGPRIHLEMLAIRDGKSLATLRDFVPDSFALGQSARISPDGRAVALLVPQRRGLFTDQVVYLWSVDKPRPERAEGVWVQGPSLSSGTNLPIVRPVVAFAGGASRVLIGGWQADDTGKFHGVVGLYETATGKLLASARTGALNNTTYTRPGLSFPLATGQRAGRWLRVVQPWGRFDLSETAGTVAVDLLPETNAGAPLRLDCQVWDLRSGKVLGRTFGVPVGLSPDGKYLLLQRYLPGEAAVPGKKALGPRPAETILLDMATATQFQKLPAELGNLKMPGDWAWSNDSRKLMAVRTSPAGVAVWDITDRKTTILPTGQGLHLFAPEGRRLLSYAYGSDGPLKVWDLATGALVKSIPLYEANHVPGGGSQTLSMDFCDDPNRLAIRLGDQPRVVDLEAGRVLARFERSGHHGAVTALAVRGDGRLVASAGTDQTVCLWNAENGRFVEMLDGFRAAVRRLCFGPDGNVLATRDQVGRVTVWKLRPDGAQATLLWQSTPGAELQPKTFRFLRPDGTLRTNQPPQPSGVRVQFQSSISYPPAGVLSNPRAGSSLALDPAGKLLAVGVGGRVQLHDATSGKPLRTLAAGEGAAIHDLAFHPDGDILASAGTDGKVRLWSVRDARLMREWQAGQGEVRSLSFSPDGRLLASAGNDLRLWQVDDGRLLMSYQPSTQTLYATCFTGAGRFLVCGNASGEGLVLDLAQLRQRLEAMGLGW